MRTGIKIEVTGDDRARLEAIVADRHRPQKHGERARIVLRSADGAGTLAIIERAVPAGKVIHVILDNYATHNPPKVLRWLGRHPRFVFHFTPTSCSWLNAVETFFSRLTRRRLKRGVFRSIVELQAAINRFVDEHNAEPRPFVWTADPDVVLGKVTRGTQALASVH